MPAASDLVVLHRDEQIAVISSLLKSNVLPACLFLYGLPSTGKTSAINSVLKKLPHIAVANAGCVEAYTQRVLWEPVLNQIAGYEPSSSSNFAPSAKCDSLCDFIECLPKAVQHRSGQKDDTPVCIVFDHAERLRNIEEYILSAVLRLREFTGLNICSILISHIPFEKFRSGTGLREPFQLHFPQYKKDEIIDILALDCPGEVSEDFYKNYVRLLLSVFWTACRDLSELRYMAKMNFSRYCQPITSGDAQENDQMKLWKNAEPIFRQSLAAIYSRDVSSVVEEDLPEDQSSEPRIKAALDLPFFSKYLLIAAFLASYNPSKYDKRLFVKHHGKQKKTKAFTTKKETYNSQLLGPKPFPLDRLLAIFYSVVEDKVAPTANIFSQVTSLVTLRLINRLGVSVLDNPKYRCAVGLDFVRHIARTVSFDIIPYLYDRGISQ